MENLTQFNAIIPPIPAITQLNFTSSSTIRANAQVTSDSPEHKDILEMHANSESSALLYVIVVLALYIFALMLVLNKYLRTEHYESRLSRLYENFLRRDSFLARWSKRRHQAQAGPHVVARLSTTSIERGKDAIAVAGGETEGTQDAV